MEQDGRAKYKLVGHRKFYNIAGVRHLLAQRQTGREKMTISERSGALVDYARWKLGLPEE